MNIGGGRFSNDYRCYSVSMMGSERQDVDKGGKIILPASALESLTRLNIQYPMLFKLTNKNSNRETHCGVLEFVAEEGRVHLPYWMMNNLSLAEGDMIRVENVALPVATFAKFQAQSTDFLDITNQKAVLENALRSFACLTTGDVVAIDYNEKIYELKVLQTEPQKAVSIIECDMNVDFAPPVGYQDPVPRPKHVHDEEENTKTMDLRFGIIIPINSFNPKAALERRTHSPFAGTGNRLDGKSKPNPTSAAIVEPTEVKRGIPNYDYKKGKITFIRASRQNNGSNGAQDKENKSGFTAFAGEGHQLRSKKK